MRHSYTYFKKELNEPFKVNGELITHREGYYIKLTHHSKILGTGEIAPLKGLHKESLQDVKKELTASTKTLLACHYPSVRFGIESITTTLPRASQVTSNQLYLLNGHAPIDSKTLKIKVGRDEVKREIIAINQILKEHKEIILRLDGNKQMDEATLEILINEIGVQNIEYLEEPLKEMNRWNHFYERYKIPLAIDESLFDNSYHHLLGVKAYVIKPTLYGVKKTLRLIDEAHQNQCMAVISSTFDTEIAMATHLRLAHYANRSMRTTHGLGTLSLFKSDS